MSDRDKVYFVRRAAEEAEQALAAGDHQAEMVHRRLQRAYLERALIGDRSIPEEAGVF